MELKVIKYRNTGMISHDFVEDYYWEKNSGYGTKQHLLALNNIGVTPIHRKSFAPIYNMLN